MRLFAISGFASALWLLVGPSAASPNGNAVEEILAADRAFAARALEIGPGKAFQEFAAEDVRGFPNGRAALKGKAAIVEWTDAWPADLEIRWEPEEAVAGIGGDLGYSWGYAEFQSENGGGGTAVSYGKYLTVWRKQDDGSWKWIADIGNDAPPPDER